MLDDKLWRDDVQDKYIDEVSLSEQPRELDDERVRFLGKTDIGTAKTFLHWLVLQPFSIHKQLSSPASTKAKTKKIDYNSSQ